MLSRIVKIGFSVGLLFGAISSSYGQIYVLKDHQPTKVNVTKCDSVEQLADSVFLALKDESLDSVKLYIPDRESLKAAIDSVNPDMMSSMQDVRYQYLQNNISLRYKKLTKALKKNRMKMEDMVLMNTMIEYGVHEDGHHYAYVNLNCFRKSKEVTISFLAIKLGEKWYLGDELRLGEPKKIKRIDLEKYEKYLPNMGN